MSVQCGMWNFDQRPSAPGDISKARTTISAYGSETVHEYSEQGIQLFFLPFHVTPESESEVQPFRSSSGRLVLWDGRLDNRKELVGVLRTDLKGKQTDVGIVAAALDLWGIAALSRLIGDWALSVWNPEDRTVLLAKDFLGAKSLYYTLRQNGLAWSTLIDPLLLTGPQSFSIQEEYLAGWLSHFPAAHLSPYAGIHSVPPSSYVVARPSGVSVQKYWNFSHSKTISYREDCEYEEHFRAVFGESVRRRLRSRSPVLAELSGGMDSSSIVCMADAVAARGCSETPRLDTISYFDNSEPNWNESPFFQKVEQQRGRVGHHVPLDFRTYWHPVLDPSVFAATPASGINLSENADYQSYVQAGGYRVLLQGIGGDEALGGVPTPLPELANLLARGQGRKFFRQLLAWALTRRATALHLLGETLGQFLPNFIGHNVLAKPTWLVPEFEKRNAKALRAYSRRFRFFGPLPSFQANLAALESLRRQVSSVGLSPQLRVERRYPYLDRDLLEFLYAIPREQIVRPNQRRSLMRRALVGIVPPEILERRRKGFIARAPLTSIRTELPKILERTANFASSRARIVDAEAFRNFLEKAANGGELLLVPVLRTLLIEAWLTHLESRTSIPIRVQEQRGAKCLVGGIAPTGT